MIDHVVDVLSNHGLLETGGNFPKFEENLEFIENQLDRSINQLQIQDGVMIEDIQ